jgi:hypothetical protein
VVHEYVRSAGRGGEGGGTGGQGPSMCVVMGEDSHSLCTLNPQEPGRTGILCPGNAPTQVPHIH